MTTAEERRLHREEIRRMSSQELASAHNTIFRLQRVLGMTDEMRRDDRRKLRLMRREACRRTLLPRMREREPGFLKLVKGEAQ